MCIRDSPNFLETEMITIIQYLRCRNCSQSCCGRLEWIDLLPASALPIRQGCDPGHGLPRGCANAFLARADCPGDESLRLGRRLGAIEPLVLASAPLSFRGLYPRGHGAAPRRGNWLKPVSYTHLDVYKRQTYIYITCYKSRQTFLSANRGG